MTGIALDHRLAVLPLTRWVLAALLVTGLLMVGAQPGTAAAPGRYLDPVFQSIRVDNDLVYGRVNHGGGRLERLRLDLYRPVGDTRRNRPVAIFIHGGDSTVNKSYGRNRLIPRGFAARGFVAASIAYRDGTSGSSREAAYDTRAAVRWFKANASRYRVNPNRIVLVGSSAGAMNALRVAFNPEDAGGSGHPGYSSKVAGAVSIGGTHTEPQAIGPDEAPIAMVHATDDTVIPIAAARAPCTQTTAMGNVCEFFEHPEGGHPPDFIQQHLQLILEQSSQFICRNVLGGAACNDRNGDGKVDG